MYKHMRIASCHITKRHITTRHDATRRDATRHVMRVRHGVVLMDLSRFCSEASGSDNGRAVQGDRPPNVRPERTDIFLQWGRAQHPEGVSSSWMFS